MIKRDWKIVQVVVYPPGSPESARLEQEVRLPWDAGFEGLLEALAVASPAVYAEVCGCVTRASSELGGSEADATTLQTLDRYFSLGSPIVCPDISWEMV